MIMNGVYALLKKHFGRAGKNYPSAKCGYEKLWVFCEEEINDHDKWAKIYMVLILAITITLFIIHKVTSSKEISDLFTFKYADDYLTMLPVIIFDILCASKFLKHTKLIDHYAHKKFVLIAMQNINCNCECNSDNKESYILKLYDKLLEPPIINDNQAIKVKLDKIMLEIGTIKDKNK